MKVAITEYVAEQFEVEIEDSLVPGTEAFEKAVEEARTQYEGDRYVSVTDTDWDVVKSEFLFDVTLTAAIRVPARTEQEARQWLADALDCASTNAGAWPNGDPILFEASIAPDTPVDLVEED